MKLYGYQKEYIQSLSKSCIMAAALGAGKTIMSLAHWQQLNTGHRLLVIAPASKIKTDDWQRETSRWFGEVRADIEFMSYESLRLNDNKTRRPRHWNFVAKRNGGVIYDVIADECHALKNPQSKQSKAVLEIVRSGGEFIGLSGTPLSNGWIDFAGYSKLFGFVKGVTEFKQKYCVYIRVGAGRGFEKLVKYVNTDELKRQYDQIVFPLSGDLEKRLPKRQALTVVATMSDADKRRYNTIRVTHKDPATDELLADFTKYTSALRQASVETRLRSLMNILNDTTENVVVFYNYISERRAILKALEKTGKKVVRYDGEVHDSLALSSNASNVVVLAHYKSGSTGLNLQFATVTVYFSPTFSYQEFKQSMGRTWRTGQTKRCLYYYIFVKNSIDEDVYAALKSKSDFTKTLFERS